MSFIAMSAFLEKQKNPTWANGYVQDMMRNWAPEFKNLPERPRNRELQAAEQFREHEKRHYAHIEYTNGELVAELNHLSSIFPDYTEEEHAYILERRRGGGNSGGGGGVLPPMQDETDAREEQVISKTHVVSDDDLRDAHRSGGDRTVHFDEAASDWVAPLDTPDTELEPSALDDIDDGVKRDTSGDTTDGSGPSGA